MNRKQRRASERRGGASGRSVAAEAPPAAPLGDLFGAAVAQHRAGALGEAERRYRHILALVPNHAETHGMLAVALIAQGKIGEAVFHFEQTAALRPDLAGVQDDLGKAYIAAGKPELAIAAAARGLELEETERRKIVFAQRAKSVVFTSDHGGFRRLMLRALSEGWLRPRELAGAALSLIVLDRAVNECLERADQAWPNLLPPAELLGASGLAALAQDRLLRALLESDANTDLRLERLLTNMRNAMLTRAADAAPDDIVLAFYCAVARQCFINEYVFATSAAEAALAERMRASLDAALAAGEPCPPNILAVVGAYGPLHALTNARALPERSWPPCVEALIAQQVKEPARERRITAELPALTLIGDGVSRLVREQYEENPYPRWVTAGPAGQPAILKDRKPDEPFDVLIAGCGTGLSTTEFARYARSARFLAVDLSLASLAYAKRMAQKFGLTNIEFAQADIMRLGSIGRQFDFIDSSGVLHHLADPWEGWRTLLSLLRPGGIMEVGLYSALARRNVVAARELIARRGYRPVAADIRRCREEIAAAKDNLLLKSLIRSTDFFTTSACRDLLFHPQEHRLTLPEIKAFLAANDLQFAGFVLPPQAVRAFAARYPEASALLDLDRWHAFEQDAPDTFGGMYQFALRKSPRG